MSVIDEYLESLHGAERETIGHMYRVVRQVVPDATEGMSYAMPAFKYKGKGLVAIIANKHFLSLYPFCSIDRLGLDVSAYECTSGSIHFTADKPITDNLFRSVITSRLRQIDAV